MSPLESAPITIILVFSSFHPRDVQLCVVHAAINIYTVLSCHQVEAPTVRTVVDQVLNPVEHHMQCLKHAQQYFQLLTDFLLNTYISTLSEVSQPFISKEAV